MLKKSLSFSLRPSTKIEPRTTNQTALASKSSGDSENATRVIEVETETKRPATGGIFCASHFCKESFQKDQNNFFEKNTLSPWSFLNVPQQICNLYGFRKNSSFFSKNPYIVSKKTQIANVLRNLTILGAFYDKFATIWLKNVFTFSSVHIFAVVAWKQMANIR